MCALARIIDTSILLQEWISVNSGESLTNWIKPEGPKALC